MTIDELLEVLDGDEHIRVYDQQGKIFDGFAGDLPEYFFGLKICEVLTSVKNIVEAVVKIRVLREETNVTE